MKAGDWHPANADHFRVDSVTNPEVITAATPPAPCETEWVKSAQEQLVQLPVVEIQMQPRDHNQSGSSYIMEAQVTQVENGSCNTSISSSDLVMQEYLQITLISS